MAAYMRSSLRLNKIGRLRQRALRPIVRLPAKLIHAGGMDLEGYDSALPQRQCARVLHEPFRPRKTEGAGKAGCPPHPQPRVRNKTKHTSVVTTGSPVSPGLPCAMVLTVSFVLSPVTGLSCHRRLRNTFRRLDASVGASGPHDFAVRISAARQRVATCVHRIPHPTFVTTAKRPSVWGGTGRDIHLICISEKQKYFFEEERTNGATANSRTPPDEQIISTP